MHEKHKVWKREFGFERIETAAEMDEKRSRISTSPVPNPFFYRNMVIPEHPHTPEEFTLQMKVDVEGLRMEIILSQPPSSECVHRCDAPRSIRNQRNPERRRSRLRLVRVQDPREKFLVWSQYGWVSAFKPHKPGAGVYFSMIKGGVYFAASSTRSRNGRRQQRHHFTRHHSRGVCETTNWPAARDGSVVNRPKQAVR